MKTPTVTADAAVIERGRVLLVKRGEPPFRGMWALPGGHVEHNERVEDAAVREAREETGLEVEPVRLVGVYSKPGRDPRGHYITIAYLCEAAGGRPEPGGDAEEVWWFPLGDLPRMAFDHAEIVEDARGAAGV